MLNLTPRNHQVFIGGLDCTDILVQADGGDSHYQQGTGLVMVENASFILHSPDFPESLDHRTNPRWARGKEIKFYAANSSGVLELCPKLGTLYILDSQFDGIRELRITAGCVLKLLSFRTPPGDGACFSLGEETSLDAIVEKLLTKAGVNSYSISLSGNSLTVPLPKLSNESYIDMAGKACASNGYILFQREDGVVTSKKIDLNPPAIATLVIGEDEVSYLPLSGIEQPPEKVIASGIKRYTAPVPTPQDKIDETFGTLAIVGLNTAVEGVTYRVTEKATVIDGDTRKVINETIEEKPKGVLSPYAYYQEIGLGISQTKIETAYYEIQPEPQLDNCNQPDEGRLLRQEIEIKQPYNVAFYNYQVAHYDELVAEGLISVDVTLEQYITSYTPTDLVTTSLTVTTYTYNDISIINAQLPLERLKIVTETFVPLGLITNDFELLSPFDNGTELKRTEKQEQIWLETGKERWDLIEYKYQALILAEPETIEQMKAKADEDGTVAPAIETYLGMSLRQRIKTPNVGRPSAPDRFPQTQEIKEEPLKAEIYLPSYAGNQFKEREKEIRIDDNFVTSVSQLQEVAKIEGALIWGQFQGATFSTDLRDELFGVQPLDRVNWIEKDGTVQCYLLNGLSVAWTNRRLSVSADGVWIGQSRTITYTDGSTDTVLVPPYEQFGVLDILKATSKSSAQVLDYPYDLSGVVDTLTTGDTSTSQIIEIDILGANDNCLAQITDTIPVVDILNSADSSSAEIAEISVGETFTYSSFSDSNGVFYYYGTNFGAESWENPVTRDLLDITVRDSVFSNPDIELVNRVFNEETGGWYCPAHYYYDEELDDNIPLFDGWVVFDLKTKKLQCNYYYFRIYMGSGEYGTNGIRPTNWKLQGSNNNTDWTDLDIKTNQTYGTGSSTFQKAIPVTSSESYRYFRMLQTGTSKAYPVTFDVPDFGLNEFELYGILTDI